MRESKAVKDRLGVWEPASGSEDETTFNKDTLNREAKLKKGDRGAAPFSRPSLRRGRPRPCAPLRFSGRSRRGSGS